MKFIKALSSFAPFPISVINLLLEIFDDLLASNKFFIGQKYWFS